MSARATDAATTDTALDELQRVTFGYFLKEANPANGLVPDNTRKDSHCSIAGSIRSLRWGRVNETLAGT
jgi:hypothetical protein